MRQILIQMFQITWCLFCYYAICISREVCALSQALSCTVAECVSCLINGYHPQQADTKSSKRFYHCKRVWNQLNHRVHWVHSCLYVCVCVFVCGRVFFCHFRTGTWRGTPRTPTWPSVSSTRCWCGFPAFICGSLRRFTSCFSNFGTMAAYPCPASAVPRRWVSADLSLSQTQRRSKILCWVQMSYLSKYLKSPEKWAKLFHYVVASIIILTGLIKMSSFKCFINIL